MTICVSTRRGMCKFENKQTFISFEVGCQKAEKSDISRQKSKAKNP